MTERAGSEIAVIGLGASGRAVAALLARDGASVYASDTGTGEDVRSAAASLSLAGVAVDVGQHDLARIARASKVVVSPGVPPTAAPIRAAADAGVPIVSEVEVALGHLRGLRYIAVTGTNGKTTTTALIGHVLRALGHDVVDAGNIGLALAEVALDRHRPEWVALELSSFQLHDTPSIDPDVGVLTNLSPDHLDRYPSARAYYADKALLFANAGPDSKFVLNGDDPEVQALTASVPGHRATFSIEGRIADAAYARAAGRLELEGRVLMPRRELPLLGDHNVANALAAVLAVAVADEAHRTPAARERMADALRSFKALPHRLQSVGIYGGVEWINDSKATNVSSTRVALEGMLRPTIVLLGGRHKGQSYSSLAEPLRRVGKIALAYGEAAPIIARDLADVILVEHLGSDFGAVMARARMLAAPGDAVLLSPACSSFDMFRNYQERGATFARLAGGAA